MGSANYRFVKAFFTLVPLLLGLPIALDMFIPALPRLIDELSANHEHVQLVLSFVLLFAAGGPLLLAPIADASGRRNVIIICTLLYTISSLLCAYAKSIEQLWLARIIQTIGASGTFMIAAVMIYEQFKIEKALLLYCFGLAIVLFLSFLFPSILALSKTSYLWQGAFELIAAIGVVSLLLVLLLTRETLGEKHRVELTAIASRYWCLIKHHQFMTFAGSFATCVGFLYIIVMYMPDAMVATVLLLEDESNASMVFIAGVASISAMLSAKCVYQKGLLRTVFWGLFITLIAGGMCILSALFFGESWVLSTIALACMCIGIALTMPASLLGGLQFFVRTSAMSLALMLSMALITAALLEIILTLCFELSLLSLGIGAFIVCGIMLIHLNISQYHQALYA